MKLLLEQEKEEFKQHEFLRLVEKETYWFLDPELLEEFELEDFKKDWIYEFYSEEEDTSYLVFGKKRLTFFSATTSLLANYPEMRENFVEQLRSRLEYRFLKEKERE